MRLHTIVRLIKELDFSEPERTLVILKDEPSQNSVNFTCYANEVYPAPKLILYKDKTDDFYNKYSRRH